jgi:hypothetical protein
MILLPDCQRLTRASKNNDRARLRLLSDCRHRGAEIFGYRPNYATRVFKLATGTDFRINRFWNRAGRPGASAPTEAASVSPNARAVSLTP